MRNAWRREAITQLSTAQGKCVALLSRLNEFVVGGRPDNVLEFNRFVKSQFESGRFLSLEPDDLQWNNGVSYFCVYFVHGFFVSGISLSVRSGFFGKLIHCIV